ncbi:MAG: uL15 family ribosomal protein [Parcubacteria group bacterium]
MQINDLKITTPRKKRKTVGRGGKKGTYCGKGCKGQKARSGAHVDPLFEGGRSTLIDHMKKKKGFKVHRAKPVVIKFIALTKKFKNGDEITLEALVKHNLLKGVEACQGVKVLGPKVGKFEFSFSENILASKSIVGERETIENK